jgi:ABC-type molybdate transport system ATPase subunit
MSTPGLKGQSGGPAFDIEGRVWGIQSATNHLDLDFDVDQEVIRGGHTKRVKDSAFLHVGHCVHVEIVKTFMKENNVQFQEG